MIILSFSLVNAINIIPLNNDGSGDTNILGMDFYFIDMALNDCTESWSCGSWSSCVGGTQTRTCTDANSCGTITSRPALSQSCTENSGGGSGSNSIENCENGEITYLCDCEGSQRITGYCFDDVYTLDNPNEDDEGLQSGYVEDYNFVIYFNKYAFEPNEDFVTQVKTYKGDELHDSSQNTLTILKDGVEIKTMTLLRKNLGEYQAQIINTLEKGTYIFRYNFDFSGVEVVESKNVMITGSPNFINSIVKPTGNVRSEIILFGIIIIILGIIGLRIYKKRKK